MSIPFTSVIVPVYNEESNITALLDSLFAMDFPRERYEIIIVDNNSTDATKDIVQKYPVILLQQKEKQNSYASRNLGIEHATGEILAFTDGDCTVDKYWLSRSVSILAQNPIIDIVAGKAVITFKKKNLFSFIDEIRHLKQDKYVSKGRCATVNMITRKALFANIGLFRDDYVSGGDFEWSLRATRNGARIVYSDDVVVFHKARETFKSLAQKRARVGYGVGNMFRDEQSRPFLLEIINILFFKSFLNWITLLVQKQVSFNTFFKCIIVDELLMLYYLGGFIKGSTNR